MKTRGRATSRLFFIFILFFVGLGFFIFASASLGLLGRGGPSFSAIAIKQLLILASGLLMMLIISKFDYRIWRRFALPLFIIALILTTLVFIPNYGIESGGAHRWIPLGPVSFQPSEFLKLALVIYLASLITKVRQTGGETKEQILPFLFLITAVGLVLVKQPDIDALAIILASSFTILFISGLKLKHLAVIILIFSIAGGAIIATQPHVRARVETFFNPNPDKQGNAYQVNQSLIAIGSGQWFGRGFGQSIHKYKLLPEPIGDSVYAVAGEEFGFMGAGLIILAFMTLGLWGVRIASRAPDQFGRLLVVGVVTSILLGAFTNIASMLALIPFAGTTLPFVSQGGSSLFFTLAGVGLILNVAKQQTIKL